MALKPVDEAKAYLLEKVTPVTAIEQRSLSEALNCCLAQDVVSSINVPPADNSAMDGYAICHATSKAGSWMPVSDRIPAGHTGSKLEPGTAARIFTGAEIPEGADTVVIQEDCEAEGDKVLLREVPVAGDNVRRQGQDITSGTVILHAGDRLSASSLGLVASIGQNTVSVHQPLKIAIMSTGDELVEPGGEVAPGQIYNSNRYALGGVLRELGMEVVDLGIVEDSPEATEQALLEAAAAADCILTSGGVSVGEEDHVKAAVEKLGSLDLWKLAIKPGKPLAYGEVQGTPFFGLPGNPVSTFVTFMVIAKSYLLAMQGFRETEHPRQTVPAAFNFTGGSRREYLRVKLVQQADGSVCAERFTNQGSGIMTSVVWADALAEVEIDQTVHEGDVLKVLPLNAVWM